MSASILNKMLPSIDTTSDLNLKEDNIVRKLCKHLTKAEIILKGIECSVDFSLTHSCYDPVANLACGHCDSCIFRKRGFIEAKIEDPTRYC